MTTFLIISLAAQLCTDTTYLYILRIEILQGCIKPVPRFCSPRCCWQLSPRKTGQKLCELPQAAQQLTGLERRSSWRSSSQLTRLHELHPCTQIQNIQIYPARTEGEASWANKLSQPPKDILNKYISI